MAPSQPAMAPEIIWFSPSDEYLEDPLKTLSVIHESSYSKGMLGNFHGVDAEDEDTRVFVMAWRSLEHHQSFMGDASYVDFIMPVMDSMVGTGVITQVLLDDTDELQKALTAPITAFIYITMRPLHDRAYEMYPLVEKYRQVLRTIPGCYGSSWGPSIERKNTEVGIVGWRSLEVRGSAVLGGGPVSLILATGPK
ncbi:hypothetical protein D9611_008822 [Ephemerocybe angulata]|uniref:ABM domain-containing protein n=1 Tax=Ephemerocybe angulata TaxID=980116 RepID=A0A8H5CEC3_9AGAR|nr:hypothetical protein D9611_008822 [Tulosesus angulatus]